MGSYTAQQLLLHAVRRVVDRVLVSAVHLVRVAGQAGSGVRGRKPRGGSVLRLVGEVLATRHNLLHSRIQNVTHSLVLSKILYPSVSWRR